MLWVTIRNAIFLFPNKNIYCGYSLEAPYQGGTLVVR